MFLLEMRFEENNCTHWKPFKSFSVAIGKTLSRVQSPMSMASHELHKIFHICPVSRSCTITLLTYLIKQKLFIDYKTSHYIYIHNNSPSAKVARCSLCLLEPNVSSNWSISITADLTVVVAIFQITVLYECTHSVVSIATPYLHLVFRTTQPICTYVCLIINKPIKRMCCYLTRKAYKR